MLATGGDDGAVRLWEVIEDRPVPRLPSYRSDATAPVDELSRAGDAVALAELVTAVTAKPPLAVGLFGDWGEGKSHFLELLQQQVAATARPDNLLAHSAVRQVRFNAWHYAETDLWASLVAELFAQLAAAPDGDLGAEQRRQSRLAADLVAERGLRERLQAARDRRDELQEALRKAERDDLGSWEALSDGAEAGADPAYRRWCGEVLPRRCPDRCDAARDRPTARGGFSGHCARRPWPGSAVVFAVVIAAAIVVAWLIPSLVRWSVTASVVASMLTVAELVRQVERRDGQAGGSGVEGRGADG